MCKKKTSRQRGFAIVIVLIVLALIALAYCDVKHSVGDSLLIPKEVPPCIWAP